MNAAESNRGIGRVTWEPPILSFIIERHGGTVHRSSRAELHYWAVDAEARTANFGPGGFRQLKRSRLPLDVKPVATEIVELILSYSTHQRLQWNADGDVRIKVGRLIAAEESMAQATLKGRRKRFATAMQALQTEAGWRELGASVYVPPHNGLV